MTAFDIEFKVISLFLYQLDYRYVAMSITDVDVCVGEGQAGGILVIYFLYDLQLFLLLTEGTSQKS